MVVRVAVDARPLSAPLSGVARVISRVIQFFPESQRFSFVLYSHAAPHHDFAYLLEMPNVEWQTGRGWTARLGGLWFNFTLPLLLRRSPPDLFWGSQQVIPPLLPRDLPVVLTYYDLVLYKFPEAMRPLARWQQRAVQGYSVRRADRILSISKQTQDDMIARFGFPPERASVAHLGYEAVARRSGEYSDLPKRPFFLSVSTLEPRKNYGLLLAAFEAYLAAEGDGAYDLVIAGRRGWESPAFFRKLNALVATGRLHIIEGATDSDLSALYSACRFFCMPTLYEGFGLPLLEALAHGAPSLASDLGCLREIGGVRAHYLPPGETDAWTKALREWTELDRMGKLSRVVFPTSEWTWERTARCHWAAFAGLL